MAEELSVELMADVLEVGVLDLLRQMARGDVTFSPAIAAVLAEAQGGALDLRSRS